MLFSILREFFAYLLFWPTIVGHEVSHGDIESAWFSLFVVSSQLVWLAVLIYIFVSR